MSSSLFRGSASAAQIGDEVLDGINLVDLMQCAKASASLSFELEAKDISDEEVETLDKCKDEL